MRNKGLILILAFAVVLTFSIGVNSENPDDLGAVNIYNSFFPHTEQIVREAMDQELPEVAASWFHSGTERVMTRVASELEAGQPQWDLLMVTGFGHYLSLKDQDALMRYESPVHDDLPEEFVDEDEKFATIRVGAMGIAYNTDLVDEDEAPEGFWDLADPKWEGIVAMPNPLYSGSAFSTVEALQRNEGWELFEALRENNIRVEAGNTAVERALVDGEVEVAILLEENTALAIENEEPIDFVYPEEGTVVIPSPVAIQADTINPEGAKAVYDFMFEEPAQQAFIDAYLHSPVPGMPNPPHTQPIEQTLENALHPDWERMDEEENYIKNTFEDKVLF